MRLASISLALIACCTLASGTLPGADLDSAAIGHKVTNFKLRDFRGKQHSLKISAGEKGTIIYFMGTDCPLAKLYGPRLQSILEEFSDDGIVVLGINSNVQDSITELDAYARRHSVKFPILKDVGNKVADDFNAQRTPEVFLLDSQGTIRYHGRIDDQYTFGSGVGLASPSPKRRDLAEAIQELVAGKEISVPVTPIRGCIIGRVRKPKAGSKVTYSNQISRLIQKRCLNCHREGQIGPFTMTSYEEVAGWGEMIAEVVEQDRMPPWHASRAHGDFSNDSHLTEKEKDLIAIWVTNGCPEGDKAQLPVPVVFKEKWFIDSPDAVIYIDDEPIDVKAEGVDPYRYYSVDPGFTEDKWVSMVECRPGNAAVVHHIIAFIRPPGQSRSAGMDRDVRGFNHLAGFAPGTRPLVLPDGWAKRIPAGSKIVFQMHYTPIGSPQKDRSSVALKFIDAEDVTHEVSTTNATQYRFLIPPGDANYKVEADRLFARDAVLLSLFPHMHMRGKSFVYELTYPDGKKEILLDVPQYDFNWQNSYILREPKAIPAGSRLHCTAYFDNSLGNLANPDPTKSVRWGDQTWEEMMIGWYDVGIPVDVATKIRGATPTPQTPDKQDE
jgi:peroxiredoxin